MDAQRFIVDIFKRLEPKIGHLIITQTKDCHSMRGHFPKDQFSMKFQINIPQFRSNYVDFSKTNGES